MATTTTPLRAVSPSRKSPPRPKVDFAGVIKSVKPTTRGRDKTPATRSAVDAELANFRNQFRLDRINDFHKILKAVIVLHKSIVRFKVMFAKMPAGYALKFETQSNGVPADIFITTHDVATAEEAFIIGVKNLYHYLRTNKRKRTTAGGKKDPASLTGVYEPKYMVPGANGSPLQAWLQAENFGNLGAQTLKQAVIAGTQAERATANVSANGLTLFEQGYALGQTVETLFYIAAA